MKTVTLDVRSSADAMAEFAGVLTHTKDGRIVFPFDAVKVEFMPQAA